MNKIILILSICSLAWGQSGDLDSVIREIFGTPKPGQATTTGGVFTQPSTIVPPPQTDSDSYEPCQLENGSSGVCVKYYLCNAANNSVITDGIGIIDIRVQDGPCKSYLDVCCSAPDTREPDNPITPPPPVEKPSGCGYRNPEGVGFHITGDKDGEAKFGEFPWMVAILKIEPVNDGEPNGQKLNVYVGGGSLIHPSVVLTAAHYVHTSPVLRVRVGEWDTQTTKEIYPYQDRDVSRIIVHKDFNKGNLFYDIALLALATPIDMNAPNVGVVCLPPYKERAVGGTQCFASGWGKDKFGKEGRYQVILKKVQLPVVERNKCEAALTKTRLGKFFKLHSSFMCAGGVGGQDTCKGDGGSPLVCPIQYEKDRFVQNGIVAWGIGCGQDGTPGVYVDVGNLREWIDNQITGLGLVPDTYTYLA